MDQKLDELNKLIKKVELDILKCKNETPINDEWDGHFDYMLITYGLDQEAKISLNKLNKFLKKNNCNEYEKISKIIERLKTVWENEKILDDLLSELKSLEEDDFKIKTLLVDKSEKEKVLFISHAEKDSFYISKIIDLVQFLGLKSKNKIFCSSQKNYKIPENEDIYNYLKSLFKEKDLYVVTLLSKNYYNSVACLNEMGASWINSCEKTVFIAPGFEFKHVKGAINPGSIMIKLTEDDRLNDFKDKIIKFFELDDSNIDVNAWEDKRNKIINNVEEQYKAIKHINTLVDVECLRIRPKGNNLECKFKFNNDGSNEVLFSKLKLELKDSNDRIASIDLTEKHHEIFARDIFSTEKRIEVLEISFESFNKPDDFDFHSIQLKDCKTKPYWN